MSATSGSYHFLSWPDVRAARTAEILRCPAYVTMALSYAFHSFHIAANWQIYSGMQDQYKQDGVTQGSVKKIISHPDYNQMTYDYDIALLELSEPLKFTNTIQPICLPDSSHMFPAGMSCWVTGWGAMREGGIIIM